MADLTTTEAVKGWAGITSSGDDVAIGGVVSAVSVLIHSMVGHDYEGTPILGETHRGAPSGQIILRRPAVSIEEIRERGSALDADDYELDYDRVVFRLSNGELAPWALGKRAIEVDYTPVSVVPDDLELAAREVAAWVWKQSGHDTGASRLGLSAQANADTGTADYFAQSLGQLPMANATLRRYKRYA